MQRQRHLPPGGGVAFLQPPEQLVVEECAVWILHEDEKRLRLRLDETSSLKQNAKTRLQSIVYFATQEAELIKKALEDVESLETSMRQVII